ncbi:roadblock/LC7 domain-containing protein [Streptomyces sp. NPDC001404]|uniref:roadblock/LC7 domain-containing protein n=1 Tax=Streptomyces sp. NPDC001404 TaxID=3364571 RepID=UPI003692F9F6
MNEISTVQKLLDDSIERVPQLRCALVVSVDGLLRLHSPVCRPDDDGQAEKRAALASSLASIASAMTRAEGIGKLGQVIIEAGQGACLFGTTAQNNVIGLYTDSVTNVGDVGFELGVLLEKLPGLLDSHPRGFAFSTTS